VKVAVVVEFEPLRLGLANMIREHPELALVGEAASLEEMLSSRGCRSADVAVMDVEVAYRTPLDVVEKTAKTLPDLKILLLLGSEQDARGVQAETLPAYLSLPGVGFLVKGESSERLTAAIILLAQGIFVAEMWVIRHVLTQLSRWANEEPASQDHLTEREMEVLRLVADGLSNREIADALFLSEGTVKIHVSHIMSKLSMDRRTELVRYAVTRGLVTESG
jgi:NarL family two-component system response regulator LiaR